MLQLFARDECRIVFSSFLEMGLSIRCVLSMEEPGNVSGLLVWLAKEGGTFHFLGAAVQPLQRNVELYLASVSSAYVDDFRLQYGDLDFGNTLTTPSVPSPILSRASTLSVRMLRVDRIEPQAGVCSQFAVVDGAK